MAKTHKNSINPPRTASPFEKLVMVTCGVTERRVIHRWLSGDTKKQASFKRRCLWRCCLAVRGNTTDQFTLLAVLVGFDVITEDDFMSFLGKKARDALENTSIVTWPSETIEHLVTDLLGTYQEAALEHLKDLSTKYKTLGDAPYEKNGDAHTIAEEKTPEIVAQKKNSAASTSCEISLLVDVVNVIALRVEKLCTSGTPSDREKFRNMMDKKIGKEGSVFAITRHFTALCSETAHQRRKGE